MDKFNVSEEQRIKLGKVIREKREEKKLSQSQLAYKTEINNADIHRLEKGDKKKINPYYLIKLAKALNIDYKMLYKIIDYLEEEDKPLEEEVKFLDSKVVELPVYGKAAAGTGYINLENILSHKRVIANGFGPESFIVEVTGDSMSTEINDGDVAVVDPQQKDYTAGKVYVVTYNDQTYIKQLQCPKKNMIVLKSFNAKYEDKYIMDEEIEQLKVEGRVVKVISEKRF